MPFQFDSIMSSLSARPYEHASAIALIATNHSNMGTLSRHLHLGLSRPSQALQADESYGASLQP